METIGRYCDLDKGVSEVSFSEKLSELNEDDLLVFIPERSEEGICMSKEELMDFWFEHGGYNWGNCRDFTEGSPSNYCNRYYRIPKTNQYVSDAFAEMVRDSTVQVYRVVDNDVYRRVGEVDSKVYSLCPGEDGDCDYIEDVVISNEEDEEFSSIGTPATSTGQGAAIRTPPTPVRRGTAIGRGAARRRLYSDSSADGSD